MYEGNLDGSSFTGDPEDYVEVVTGDGHLSAIGPVGEHEWVNLTGTLRDV
jgi:hypothetical protein